MKRRKVIIDCDPGIDDALAILLAVNSDELEVVGLTVCSGNVPIDLGAKNPYGRSRCYKKNCAHSKYH